VGVLTDRDHVVRVLAQDGPATGATAIVDVMTSKLVTAQEGDALVDALKKMRSFGARRLPVVNERGGLEEILAFDDLVEFVTEKLGFQQSPRTRAEA
jgi:CBS domain-containing protein